MLKVEKMENETASQPGVSGKKFDTKLVVDLGCINGIVLNVFTIEIAQKSSRKKIGCGFEKMFRKLLT